MKVLGLRCKAGIPILDLLCADHPNPEHENHIEIARRYYQTEQYGHWSAILLIHGQELMSVYKSEQFQSP